MRRTRSAASARTRFCRSALSIRSSRVARALLADFVEDEKLDNVDRTVSLRGRDLRGAVLVRTDLRKADFTGAIMDDTDLSRGRFDQASFGCAKKSSGTLEDKS